MERDCATVTIVMTDSAPAVLFEMPFDRSFEFVAYYDVSPDGQRFLVVSDRPTTDN